MRGVSLKLPNSHRASRLRFLAIRQLPGRGRENHQRVALARGQRASPEQSGRACPTFA